MKKGKSRTRNARVDLMRPRAANAWRKAKSYDRHQYDKPAGEET